MQLTYRLLTTADALAFRDIRQRSLREHTDMFTSTAEEWGLELQTYIDRIAACPTIGAFDGDRLIGNAILGLVGRDRTKTRHKSEVWSVYTVPEARGRGVARKMMRLLIDEAKQRGLEALVLTVASHNVQARALYESLGFYRYGTEPRHVKLPDGRYIDDDLMQLDLV